MSYQHYIAEVTAEFQRAGHLPICGHDPVADVNEDILSEYRRILDSAEDERPLQRFLERYPAALTGELGMYCRWVLPQVRLGGRYVPDFLTARLDSGGVKWTAIELESPTASLFNKDGTPSRSLRKGISQIGEWRRWLIDNQALARRPQYQDGLGLLDISGAFLPGIVIIGRADTRTPRDRELLRQVAFRYQVEVRTYDFLTRDEENRRAFRAEMGTDCANCRPARH
ncbi:Shedu anti-phage system protein SduA domain-containing protein [Micromonospora sp. WMMA1976]|uniref:Shedu anti-phage system protein SduA domain-containing protein n=1 Tax=Micromonospora sp. WMMA1976 TaxID=3014995 RepID=UPI00248BFFDD|nr:Shedu anti-phage system protein SduA domain-containing protein [Micromonospora sp. WMMA1976]WBC04259.1 DUF4263 domain-containing protein [Micromonospora sp. WMMA1976]